MPLFVVHGLEAVDVDEQQGQGGLVAHCDVELSRELLLEPPVVAEPGQRIEQGLSCTWP